jgi:predicted TPR repeat methyltransferase
MQLNFGNISRTLGRTEVAERAYREAIRLDPRSADAYCNLASLYRLWQRNADARPLLEKAIELNPRHGETYHNLANLLREEEDVEGAVRNYNRAVELYADQRGRSRASSNLASTLSEAGQTEEAEKVVREWLAREPGNPTAHHLLAALTQKDVPARASDEYVRELFDSFAGSFEDVLDNLRYRAPKLVGERLQRLFPEPAGDKRVLDAGCGTGFAGEFVRPYAERLIGIDLSSVMLEKAGEKNLYDELEVAEATAYLVAAPGEFDLIISVDTLCYFGDLDEVIAGARSALKPGGTICFSVEKTEVSGGGSGFQLVVSGRYAHQRPYVEATLAHHGFTSIEFEEAVLRLENGQPVMGYVVSAMNPVI